MGKKSSPPPAPDYAAAAERTSAGDLANLRASTKANRPNEITPLGQRTWTQPGRTFDRNAFQTAMKAYQQQLSAYNAGGGQQPAAIGRGNSYQSEDAFALQQQQGGAAPQAIPKPVAPNANDYYTGGDPDSWTSTTTLAPEQQKLFDQQNRLSSAVGDVAEAGVGRVADSFADPIDPNDYQQQKMPVPVAADANARQQTIDAMYGQQTRLMDPQWQQQQAALENQVANMGLARGSEAWNKEIGNLQRARMDAYGDARDRAIMAGGQEQSRLFQMQQGAGQQQFANEGNLRNQQIQEAMMLRQLPLNEMNALRTGAQTQMPQFQGWTPQGTAKGPDYLGAANAQYGATTNAYNAGVAGDNAMFGGLMSLGGAAMGSPWLGGLMGLG